MTVLSAARTPGAARIVLTSGTRHLLWSWAGMLLFTWVMIAGVAAASQIRVSGWSHMAPLLVWLGGFWGAYLVAARLPLFIAHGRSRRSFAVGAAAAAVPVALLAGALATAGFAVESLVYGLMGWPWRLEPFLLLPAADHYPLIFASYTLAALVAIPTGAMLAAAFSRSGWLGLLLLPGVLLLVAMARAALYGEFRYLFGLSMPQTAVGQALFVCTGVAVAAAAATWVLIRNVPLRPREG